MRILPLVVVEGDKNMRDGDTNCWCGARVSGGTVKNACEVEEWKKPKPVAPGRATVDISTADGRASVWNLMVPLSHCDRGSGWHLRINTSIRTEHDEPLAWLNLSACVWMCVRHPFFLQDVYFDCATHQW